MYNIGDYVVCPGHGVGQVYEIKQKEMTDSVIQTYYTVKIIINNMTIMVPENSVDGIRPLVSTDEIVRVYELLDNHDVKLNTSTWNRRHREYLNKIKTGSLLEIAEVLRELFLLKHVKNLSFGEKRLLEQCKILLVKEIAISSGNEENSISGKIDSYFVSEAACQ